MKLNLRERLAEFRASFLNVLRRHPLELLLLLALTVTLIVCLEIDEEPNGPRMLILGWGALLLLIVNRLAGRSVWRRIYWVAWAPLVPLFLWPGLPEWVESAQAVITFAILTPLALLACRRAVANERFVADALVCLRSAVLAMLFAYVAYGLFVAILWSAAYIFGFSHARWVAHLSADLFFVTQFLAVPTLFMMMLDRWDEARFGSSRILEYARRGHLRRDPLPLSAENPLYVDAARGRRGLSGLRIHDRSTPGQGPAAAPRKTHPRLVLRPVQPSGAAPRGAVLGRGRPPRR